ncbi:MAG: membrane protein insertion efficiency factor YidD [Alphaproteobacteria bacterium]|nr:membrane protein insertion efficiency factor YidD [Alphaproteobacteria bacterium]
MSNFLQQFLLFGIWVYRKIISPWITPRCRYLPTCSSYAMDAIHIHGPYRGFKLALCRIGRCHPWGKSGFDPVITDNEKNEESKR